MNIFIKKIIIFLIPVGLILIFPALVLFFGREYYSIEAGIKAQITKPETIFGFSYNNLGPIYKKLLIDVMNPEVITLGSSRVMQFRKEFFTEPNKFINAGGGATGIDNIEEFIKRLPPDNKVNFIILGLDQEMFKVSPSVNLPLDSNSETYYQKNVFERFVVLLIKNWKKIYQDYFLKKFSLVELSKQSPKTNNIGISAIINKDGFRHDGSYQYGKVINGKNRIMNLKLEIDKTLQLIKQDRSSFRYGESISKPAINYLGNILKLSKERGIYVIGFLPPYANQTYQEMVSVDDSYKKIVIDLPNELNSIFSNYDFSFYDFSDIRVLGANDNEFIDQSHGTDKLYLRMIIHMAEKNKELNQYTDLNKLKEILQQTNGDFLALNSPNNE